MVEELTYLYTVSIFYNDALYLTHQFLYKIWKVTSSLSKLSNEVKIVKSKNFLCDVLQ